MRAQDFPLRAILITALTCACALTAAGRNFQAPDWMHALVNVPLPTHDEKTDAVLIYSDDNLTVLSDGKFRSTLREAYKILRPEGRGHGQLEIPYDSLYDKILSIHAWCIPSAGKDYEVTDKDAIDRTTMKGEDFSLVTSERFRILEIPAPDPGNIIGFEIVTESHPPFLQDFWAFQEEDPVRESHYSLTLPSGWNYRTAWANYPEVKADEGGGDTWKWSVSDVKPIRVEEDMPPASGLAAFMVVTLLPPGATNTNSLASWQNVGDWYQQQSIAALVSSPEIKQEVAALTASAPTQFAKMQAIAEYIQNNVRYVAISLKIGGWKPHPAPDVFIHRYGDCKDKATLMQMMLKEIGVDSYYVFTNIERDTVTPQTPPHVGAFDHAIIAIKVPEGLAASNLQATLKDPQLGTLLIFDPTNEKTPLGEIGSYLQDNYSLLGTPSGGELIELPRQPAESNGIQRTANLTLSEAGILSGSVHEVRVGDRARESRGAYLAAQKSSDKIMPVEQLLSDSLSSYQIGNATISNLKEVSEPLIWDYTFQADSYAKFAGDMLLVRPRVLGRKERGILETPEPRLYDIEFDDGPVLDTDTFEITLPKGYVVDDLPPAVDADFGFASYHSKTEVVGNVLRYHRTFEEKELSVPVNKADQLKKFYRIIASDERNTAVLKLQAQ
jgi:hypothetical protein